MVKTLPYENCIKSSETTIQFCSFRVCGRLFGVDIIYVKEICNDIQLTAIFHAPEPVGGYMNIRGKIHLVIDLRKLFGFESKEIDRDSRVVIFKQSVGESFGILVDSIADVLEVDQACIVERRQQKDIDMKHAMQDRRKTASKLTCGICKIQEGLLVVLNAGQILDSLTMFTQQVQ